MNPSIIFNFVDRKSTISTTITILMDNFHYRLGSIRYKPISQTVDLNPHYPESS